ncbi:peptide ABC transporter substrate-binding protein [Moraxella bovis]|uniref:peptide ABC transporter substrate-binding protein n=1 Tax=Moraxella bovis TaxID=476 RepID=UPI002226C2C3|nr:peptide ABC transporter substrate-binding protein [Moraxella bovis]UZA36847.1 peptide ABC transporter substrate-binding protein [Moraxella bovis]
MKLSTLNLAMLTLCGAVTLTGCGGDKPSTQAGSASSISASKDSITIPNEAEPESLDLHKASDAGSFAIMRQMFVGLVSADEKGATIPALATQWSSDDGKVWTFKLRDAKWSDDKPITAHDFVYSFQRLTDPKTASPYSSCLVDAKVVNAGQIAEGKADVEALGVRAIDDKTLEITLTDPVPYLPDLLVLPVAYAVPKQAIDAHGDKWLDPANIVVSGAYKLTDWVVNSHITVERNPAYFGEVTGNINKATFLPITSASTEVNRYKAGEVELAAIPSEHLASIKKELPDEVHSSPKLCTFYLEYNHAKAPFNDVKARQAIAMALDRETIAEKVLGRGEKATYQFTPPAIHGMGEVSHEWMKLDKSARVAQAKKLIEEAGYSASKPLKFELLYSTSETGKRIATATSSMLNESFGGSVNVSIINQEWKTMLDTRRQGKFDTAFAGWCADYNEPSTFLNILRSGNSNNSGQYKNTEFDRLLDSTLNAGTSDDERMKIYHNAEAILDRDMAMVPIYTAISVRLKKPYLEAESLNDPSGNWQIKDWTLK